MKSILLGTMAVATIFLGERAALSADVPVVVGGPPPIVYDAAVPTLFYFWNGPYLGLQGGWGWTSTKGLNASGDFGGGQLGYNYQTGNLVFGLEADGALASITSHDVTIPFLGVLPSDGATLGAATLASSFAALQLPNPTFDTAALFTSQGPRVPDSVLKPNVSAPGYEIFSAAVGTGTDGFYDSGTSMATPHVAGVAVLATQAHRNWPASAVSAAVVQTSDPTQLADYWTSIEGAGVVQALPATQTQSVAFADTLGGGHALSLGFAEFTHAFHDQHDVVVRNLGNTPVAFNVTSTPTTAIPHSVHLSQTTIHVPPHGAVDLNVGFSVPAATVGATHDAAGNMTFPELAGNLTFMPTGPHENNGVPLTLPYYLVPRARSDVLAMPLGTLTPKHPSAAVLLANPDGAVTGNGDFYAWGLSGTPQGLEFADTRAVGVQSNPVSATDSVLVFAVNTFTRIPALDLVEFDTAIDVDGDGVPDYILFNTDLGWLTVGYVTGPNVSALYRVSDGTVIIEYPVDGPSNGSTVLLPVLASDLGLSPANPRLTYSTTAYSSGGQSALPGTASFNVFAPAISNALYVPVAPHAHASVPVAIDPTEWAHTPALGLMVVVEDNASGTPQATLLPVRSR